MIDPNNTQPLDAGIAQADANGDKAKMQEAADVKTWLKRVADAREFDDAARKRYAIDRQFARGDRGGFDVSLPIAQTYIDILKAFLYAKDPDLDMNPADGTTPPPMAEILKMAREQVQADPQTQIAMQAAAQGAQQQAIQQQTQAAVGAVAGAVAGKPPDPNQPAAPPIDPAQAAQQGANAALDQLVKQKAEEIMAPYKQRRSEAKQFGQTIESVVESLWQSARLKQAAEPQVGSAFTCGPGWLKASWQEQTGTDPTAESELSDVQDNLARLRAGQLELPEAADPDAKEAELKQLADGISAKVEVLIARGLVIDFVPAEDIQVATGTNIVNYVDAPWNAHRMFMSMDDAKAKFPDLVGPTDEDNKLKKATQYFRAKPRDTQTDDTGNASSKTALDADSFRTGVPTGNAGEANVCVWEVWNRQSNQVLTFIEGMDCYAAPPYAPNPGTTRFYPFFLYAPARVDGERHPQSMIQRTERLLEDMNRIYSNRREHRARCIPKTAFNARNIDAKNAEKLERGGVGEMVGLDLTDPGADIRTAVTPIAYAQIDPALYDDLPTRAMLEMAWGIQEALSSSIQTAKTATEAEIQKTGTEARTSYQRDCLDDMLTELAKYTTEIAIQKMSADDAIRIAGPFAFWPQALKIEDLSALVNVQIRAGSSGKPDTAAEREAWAQTAPMIQASIVQIGQLRGSSPDTIADCLEALVAETLRRSGDKIDPDQFLPGAPDNGSAQIAPPPLFSQPTVVPNGATLQ